MLAAALLALAAPTADQWTPLFDHGDRWPGCTITVTADMALGKPYRRAVQDIRRTTGIRILRRPDGAVHVTVGHPPELPTWALAASLPTATDGRYTAGSILVDPHWRTYWNRMERAMWLHELGHILGLGHVDNPGEVMSMRQGLAHPRPTRGYIAALHDLYPDCLK